jgi:sigma-B regulation protein RsbU (phosphoserine phosphatase)
VAGFPVGMIDEAEYDESVIDLQPGDRLYLHSDGLNEEVNSQDEAFGDERLLNAIAGSQALRLQDTVESVVQEVVDWRGEEHLSDDVSILAVSVA